ncbi:putative LPS assembly protein LptD [Pontibacter ruber]|uniref:LPS assembly protein LptD n=1 Tax=Pontibacter ruber TaxID=1343895 RepID=A0ABW5CYB0_9BACT|nr:putative LPS assembly protein LptD [Pontibacter ruber]
MLLLQLTILSSLPAKGQRVPRTVASPKDTVTITQDTTVALAAPKGDIETTIKYSARDSIQFEVDRKVVHLYGDAKINYGTMSLAAAYISIDYDKNMLTATTLPDSTGKEVGVPVFADGGETYAAKKIAYNYKTKKGRISEVVTQQGEGYIHSEVVKKNEENEIFGLHNKYTTCNLEHPHFYINATRIKAIPNDKVMSGPFNLVIADIPTPLGFLFGLFPTPKNNKRASGVIIPQFGESRLRGFSLTGGGYYLALNDYIGTRITGDIYSLGGYKVNIDNTYVKRYSYQGTFGFSYDYFKNDEADIAEQSRSTDQRTQLPPSTRSFWINWSHSPVQKPGRGRFNASVNAGSSLYQRLSYTSQSNYLAPNFNSSVSYQKNFQNTPFSFDIRVNQSQQNGAAMMRQQQQDSTKSAKNVGVMNFVLPDLNFAMTQIGIYETLTGRVPTGQWYENFTFGYSVNARNEVSNRFQAQQLSGVRPEFLAGGTTQDTVIALNPANASEIWENGQRSAVHNFQIGLGNYKVMRYFNLTPTVSYGETWLDKKFSYRFDEESKKVVVDTANFGRVYEYSAGASLNTTVYGTAYVKGKRVEAIRHIIRPSIAYRYRPDFGNEDQFGFYQTVQVDTSDTGAPVYRTLPRFARGVPSPGLQSGLSFSLDNNLEMKVKSKNDTTGTGKNFEKVSLIDNLRLSTFYNFAADSFNLSPVTLSMNTRVLKTFNINFNSTFDPYQTVVDAEGRSRRINKYMLSGSGFRPARLTQANFGLTASLNPEARRTPAATPNNLPSLQPELDPLVPNYVDFNIPWTMNLDYTVYYTAATTATDRSNLIQTVGFDGSVNVTEKWKVGYFATYNISDNNLANARLDIYRDLHCWEMSISWIPFGFQRGYNFTINARSSLLRDLRLTRNRTGLNYR